MYSSKSKLVCAIISLLSIVFLNACNPSADAFTSGTFPVDSTFVDFYREVGGSSILGPAISPVFEKEGVTYQYLASGLMVYDPNQDPLKRYRFSPIASREWKINGVIEPAPADTSLPYVNGHRIWEEAWPFYNRYGAGILGLPLTGIMANDQMQRYEQYFEGVGIYRNYSDAPGRVRLLPYGAWMCGTNCRYQISEGMPIFYSFTRSYNETEQIFLQASERLGYGFTGAPLAAPEMASDGNFEMTFENMILFIDPIDGNQVRLRPLPSWVGIKAENPTSEIKAGWLSFYPLSEGGGFNIPNTFINYIAEHGGAAYFGLPITEYTNLSDGGYAQCFTNVCLEYHPTAPESLRIRPRALGVAYKLGKAATTAPTASFSQAVQVNVREKFPLIPSGHMQVIDVEASQNGAPLGGIVFSLVVEQPDGMTKTYDLPPTGEDGKTSIELDPINGPNGAIVQYQVCMTGAVSPQVCFTRSYTIWEQ